MQTSILDQEQDKHQHTRRRRDEIKADRVDESIFTVHQVIELRVGMNMTGMTVICWVSRSIVEHK